MHFKMKISKFTFNLILSFFCIYMPMLLFSIYHYLFVSKARRIEEIREFEQDIPSKIMALNSGFKPIFYPQEILQKL